MNTKKIIDEAKELLSALTQGEVIKPNGGFHLALTKAFIETEDSSLLEEEALVFADFWRTWHGHPSVGTDVHAAYKVWRKIKATGEEPLSRQEVYHLEWLYERMREVHKENENVDYMINFKKIIDKIRKLNNIK